MGWPVNTPQPLLPALSAWTPPRVRVPVLVRVHEMPHDWSRVEGLDVHKPSPVFPTDASVCKKSGKAGSSIQRSVETGMAVEYPRGGSAMNRQASRESTDGSMNSYSSEGK